LVNTNKLLQQYIGSNIEIEKQLPNSSKDKITAKLLAVIGGIVVQSNDKLFLIRREKYLCLNCLKA
jgi:hypothetical protein